MRNIFQYSPASGTECLYGKISIRPTEISTAVRRDLAYRAGPLTHLNEIKFPNEYNRNWNLAKRAIPFSGLSLEEVNI